MDIKPIAKLLVVKTQAQMQTRFPFTEEGIGEAAESARQMRSVKSTIVPAPDLI